MHTPQSVPREQRMSGTSNSPQGFQATAPGTASVTGPRRATRAGGVLVSSAELCARFPAPEPTLSGVWPALLQDTLTLSTAVSTPDRSYNTSQLPRRPPLTHFSEAQRPSRTGGPVTHPTLQQLPRDTSEHPDCPQARAAPSTLRRPGLSGPGEGPQRRLRPALLAPDQPACCVLREALCEHPT